MKILLKTILLLSTICMYIVGNNQIASVHADEYIESQASIKFEQSYFPSDVDSFIPSGSNFFPVYTGNNVLPKTGETGSQKRQLLGFLLLGIGLILIGLNKNKIKKENIKN